MVPNASTGFSGGARFRVDLSKDNYYVSWKKLLKSVEAPPPPPPGAKPGLEARIAPEVGASKQGEEQGQGRLNSVIEKIERLYKGDDSDDEEQADACVGGVATAGADDDEYNTDDSFIDDEDLNEYFAVDGLRTKHSGFFINKGAIESLDETSSGSLKRKKQDVSSKSLKRMKAAARRSASSEPQSADTRKENRVAAEGQSNKVQKTSEFSSPEAEKMKMLSGRISFGEKTGTPDSSKPKKAKDGAVAGTKCVKPPLSAPKDGSPTKRGGPKCTALEKAIQELEKEVAELSSSRQEVEEPGHQSTVKSKRVPRDVKTRLAKVARLAGSVTEDLVARLMKTMGPYMQVKTLKKNLREMIELGLTAKKEKQGKLESIKREIVDMVRSRISLNHCTRDSRGEAQESGEPGCEGRYTWDSATEDKICDLYELYLEGMDEHKSAPSRKFYSEIAELWPDGWMDNNGIKSAVLRAKERRKGAMKQLLQQAKLEEKKRRKLIEGPVKSSQEAVAKANTGSSKIPSPPNRDDYVRKVVGNGEEASNKVDSAASIRHWGDEAFVSTSLRRIKKELNKGKDCSTACFSLQHQQQQQQQHSEKLGTLLPEPC